jgi:uncharacterized membrane protein SpoIIM required for sporulation
LSAARARRWSRLAELTRRRSLTGADADEMTRLFQQTAGDLAAVQSTAPEPGLVSRLSILLASARVWMTGAHTPSLKEMSRLVTRELPAALYRVRWFSVGVAAAFILLAAVTAVHTLHSPAALDLAGTVEERAAYAQDAFESYYSTYDAGSFALQVWTNNWWLSAICILTGITGLFPLWFLSSNAISLGVTAAVMAEHGMLDIFFQLILPHGFLELSAIFVAGGVGIRLFWTLLVPGPRSRGTALAEEGRAAFTVALGLAVVLFISGLLEALLTPSGLPWLAKDGIGALVVIAFWAYVFVVGRAATHFGSTGDVEGDFATAKVPVAA